MKTYDDPKHCSPLKDIISFAPLILASTCQSKANDYAQSVPFQASTHVLELKKLEVFEETQGFR